VQRKLAWLWLWRNVVSIISAPAHALLKSSSANSSGLASNNINTKNCSLSIVLTATHQKPQKPPSHCLNVNVMLSNMTFLMIFAVFDVSPLTLWINGSLCSLLFYSQNCAMCHCELHSILHSIFKVFRFAR